MRFAFISALLICSTVFVSAQPKIRQADWQQSCDYFINVSLDDESHTLTGDARFVYTNNSPNTLTHMYFHIWPNAYKDDLTDFAKQQLANGSTKFHFADDSLRGYIDRLDFKVNGKKATWSYYNNQIDIAVITLNRDLKPGESIEITTPFFVKIPGSFSRFGHVGQSYQITQWYPKPAVYDVNGWNPMPYLNQGEFYSEFGKFEVKITVPDNYVVAATGELQEQEEHDFLLDRTNNPLRGKKQLPSADEKKTITFVQDNVHDFAWFADKRFNVKQEDVTLSNGQVVKAYVFADQTNLNYTDDIKTALNYYSDHCGYYPYSHCTVVKGALKAGGGMEYPMITVVASLGKEVIVHEVGHNWFYGILANNERLYPWMDESINSYFEHEAIHGGKEKPGPQLKNRKFNEGGFNSSAMSIGYRQIESSELHQAIGEKSVALTNMNYGLIVYGKGSDAFAYLRDYLSQDGIDACFKALFNKWKFNHPLPGDIQDVFEETSGEKLDWFFKGMIGSESHIDYAMSRIEDGKVFVQNKGGVAAPFEVGFFKDGEMVESIWFQGGEGELFAKMPEGDFDVVKIDPYAVLPEVNRQNNTIRTSGLLKKVEPLEVKFMSVIHEPNRTSLNVLPLVGYNIHNKMMFGLWLNNMVTPRRNFGFSASPLYSPNTGDVNGYANVHYMKAQNKALSAFEIGVKGSRFAFDDANYSYNRIVPYVKLDFRHPDKRSPISSRLTLRSTLLSFTPNFDQDASINSLLQDSGTAYGRRTVIEQLADKFIQAEYRFKNAKAINPSQWTVRLEMGMPSNAIHVVDTSSNMLSSSTVGDNYVKLNLEYKKRITYKLKGKGLDIRVFGGTFLDEAENGLYHYRMESGAGKWDYTYDQILMGRGASDGLFSQQVIENDVFLKEPGTFANISQWTLAVNLKSDLPLKLPLGVYFDAFTFNDMKDLANVEKGEPFIYNGGLAVKVIPDFIEIYVPFFSSNMIKEAQKLQGINDLGQRITFKLNFNFMQDKSMADIFKLAQGG
ncbi:MAG: M1 family metallopeptidase [Bacteroidetes bacterium]|jgi:hypothetical protein|nr:M1 family metallopeptidase [Bacteroidota bacterium]